LDTNPTEVSDSPLQESGALERKSAGDFDLEEIYRKFGNKVRAVISKRLYDRLLIEDAVQETFLRAQRYKMKFDPRRPIFPWLAEIAANVCAALVTKAPDQLEHLVAQIGEDEAGVEAGPDSEQLAGERFGAVLAALARLSPRHRQVLILKYSERWSYRDIAALESVSIEALQSVLSRARRKFRAAYTAVAQERGLRVPPDKRRGLGLVLPAFLRRPLRWVRRKLEAAADRVQKGSDAAADPAMRFAEAGASTHWIAAGVLLAVLGAGSVMSTGSANGAPSGRAARSDPLVVAAEDTRKVAAQPGSPPARSALSPTDPLGGVGQMAAGVEEAVDPNPEATPENTSFYSITASPDYENDHVVFAAGFCPSVLSYGCNALFVSRDGGGSWDRLEALGFLEASRGLLLSPTFGKDGRLFAVGMNGVQKSADGGRSFQPFLPVQIDGFTKNVANIYSSADNGGSPRVILVTDKAIVEYSDDALLNPLFYSPDETYYGMAASPAYAGDRVSLLLTRPRAGSNSYMRLNRCTNSVCQEVALPTNLSYIKGAQFSPIVDGDVIYLYGISDDKSLFFASSDGARTFRQLPSIGNDVYGIAVSRNQEGRPVLLASIYSRAETATNPSGRMIYRLDGDNSWTSLTVPGLEIPELLGSTPTGRLFATGSPAWGRKGIACSEDRGATWAPRCSPEL
jgi:RNA polymerase sigma-70 factor, ECF subfamily